MTKNKMIIMYILTGIVGMIPFIAFAVFFGLMIMFSIGEPNCTLLGMTIFVTMELLMTGIISVIATFIFRSIKETLKD